jgi:hypothetical protein
MTLLLYGVVRQDHPLPKDKALAGVSMVTAENLAVLVKELEDDVEVSDTDAVPYIDALARVVRDGPVVPIRFGTVAPDGDAVVSEILAPAADSLVQTLERIEDLVELRLDFSFDEEAAIEEVYRDDEEVRAAARQPTDADLSAKIELGQLVAERMREKRAARLETWLSGVRDHAEHVTTVRASDDEEIVALLVRRDRLSEADAAVAALQEELDGDVTVQYTGPLPLFDFPDQMSADAAEQAAPTSQWGW